MTPNLPKNELIFSRTSALAFKRVMVIVLSCRLIGSLSSSTGNQRTAQTACIIRRFIHILDFFGPFENYDQNFYFIDYLIITPVLVYWNFLYWEKVALSGGFWVRQAQREVVKMKFFHFSYWASSTPWRHVLSLKTFCRNPALSWAIRYSVFQPVKFTSSFEFVCGTLFSTFWHLMVNFGYIKWF